MNTLFLTAEEQKVFQALPAEVCAGFDVTEEVVQYEDSALKRALRFKHLQVTNPALLELIEKAKKAKGDDDLLTALQQFNGDSVSGDDVIELSFALGPSVISGLIGTVLQGVKSREHVKRLAELTFARHSLLESLAIPLP